MGKTKKFTLGSRVNSFKYALKGVVQFFNTEHNAFLHFLSTIAVIVLSILVEVSKTEAILLIFAIALVWISEIFNTCIEKSLDFVSEAYDTRIKNIKDMAAGAVLISALSALAVGLIVFIPKIFNV